MYKPHPNSPIPNNPTPIPSPLERGVNTLACCWRTGHGGHRPTLRVQYDLPKIMRNFAYQSRTVASVPRPPASK